MRDCAFSVGDADLPIGTGRSSTAGGACADEPDQAFGAPTNRFRAQSLEVTAVSSSCRSTGVDAPVRCGETLIVLDRTILIRDSERARAEGLRVGICERRVGAPDEWVDTLLDAFDRLPPSGEWLVHLNGGSTYWDSNCPDTLFSEMIDVVLEERQTGGVQRPITIERGSATAPAGWPSGGTVTIDYTVTQIDGRPTLGWKYSADPQFDARHVITLLRDVADELEIDLPEDSV